MANNDDWMMAQFEKTGGKGIGEHRGRAARRPLHQEGALHGGVLMQALAKLPPRVGTTYRGERLTEEQFKKKYIENDEVRYSSFASTSLNEGTAQGFANGTSSGCPTGADLSVMATQKVNNAYDIRKWSVNAGEGEWLLPPGTVLKVLNRTELPTGPLGNKDTPAQKWWKLELAQTAPPVTRPLAGSHHRPQRTGPMVAPAPPDPAAPAGAPPLPALDPGAMGRVQLADDPMPRADLRRSSLGGETLPPSGLTLPPMSAGLRPLSRSIVAGGVHRHRGPRSAHPPPESDDAPIPTSIPHAGSAHPAVVIQGRTDGR